MANTGDHSRRSSRAEAPDENIDIRAVLRTIRQPLLVLDAALVVKHANAAFHATFQTSDADIEGSRIYDLGNGQWNIPELRRLLDDILPARSEVTDFRIEHDFEHIGQRDLVLNASRMQRAEGNDQILLTIDDASERQRLLWELEAQKEYAEKIVDASRNALLILGGDLRVKTANETFYRSFGVNRSDAEGRLIYELSNGQWNIPVLRELLENVLPDNNTFDDYEVEHEFEEIGLRTMVLNARKIDHMQWILLEIEDQTERRRAEVAQREAADREAFLLRLTDIFRPLREADDICGATTRLLGDRLGASRAFYVEWPPSGGDAEVLCDDAIPGNLSVAGRYPFDVFASTHMPLLQGRTWVVQDAEVDLDVRPEKRRPRFDAGVSAWIKVPLIRRGALNAVLCVAQDRPRNWTAAEVALVEEAAERSQAEIERARAERELEAVRERYDQIVTGASDYAIFTLDADGRVASWPAGAAAVFGWTEDEMLGAPFAKTFVPDDVKAGAPERELGVAAHDGSAPDVRWHLRKDGQRVFIDGETIRLGGADDRSGFIKIGQDITQRRRSEDLLRESEARLQAMFGSAAVGLSEIDPSGRVVRANDELCRILGRPREEVLTLSVADVTHPDDLPSTLEMVRRVLRGETGGSDIGVDKRYLRPDGTIVWANSRATLMPAHEGGLGNLLTVTVDLTERRAAEAAVRESEARFRQFAEASSDAIWIRDAETLEWEYLSPAYDRIYGVSREKALAQRKIGFLMNLVVPEDRDRIRDAIERLRVGDGVYDYRIQRPSDGEVRWLRTTGFRLVDVDGRTVRRLGGITQDMTDERRAAERMEVLVAELQHRTRNLIGVIRALASRTSRSSVSLDDFAERFGQRLDALARANGLLSRLEEGDRISFDKLLDTELAGHGVAIETDAGRKVSLRGPRGVRLPSGSVQTLALALHELMTNAIKYGALSCPEGRLSIVWELLDGPTPMLRVAWRETGITVPAVEESSPDGNGGYGRQLIERALPFQLGAETTYDLRPDGLDCTIVLPIPR